MTVAELIEKLKGLPQDAEVRIPDGGGYPEPASRIRVNPYPEVVKHDYIVID